MSGTDHRSAGILPATICRQDGGAPGFVQPTSQAKSAQTGRTGDNMSVG